MISQAALTDPQAFEDRLGHRFADRELCRLALTHRSWCGENEGLGSNERLEFLGDAVLALVVSQEFYSRFPDHDEGWLSQTRARVVNASTLAQVGRNLELGPLLQLSHGEQATGGREKSSILADAVEALIAAVYLDAGLAAARSLIRRHFGACMDLAAGTAGSSDHKTRLQELAAVADLDPPRYEVTGSGPDHEMWFSAVVSVGAVVGTGSGRTKKRAEQDAAEMAETALLARAAGGCQADGTRR